MGERVTEGGAVGAADLPGDLGEEEGVAAVLGDEANVVGLGGGGEGGFVASDVGEGLEGLVGAREVAEEGEKTALVGRAYAWVLEIRRS